MRYQTALLFGSLLLCMACTRDQYFTVSSELPQEKSGFSYENDTLRINYRFVDGEKFEITLKNKTMYPIYVDWEKSAVVFDNDILYYTKKYLEQNEPGIGYRSPDGQGEVIEKPKNQALTRNQIPPLTKQTRMFKKVPIRFHKRLGADPDTKVKSYKQKQAKKLQIAPDDAKYAFQSHIYLSFDDHSQEVRLNHKFHVSQIMELTDGMEKSQSNQIERTRVTAWGGFLGTIAGLVFLSVKVLLEGG